MSNYLIYLFEANCALLLLGLFYYAFLKNETDFRRKRLYLLGSTLFALILPLLHLDIFKDQGEAIRDIQTMVLPEIVIGGGELQEAETVTRSFSWVSMLYWSGVIVLGLWLLFQIGQVIWFFSANVNRLERKDRHIIIRTNGTLPTFSFFNLLFFDNSVRLSSEEEQRVIAHELAHIKQYHSLDILFLESVKIIFWFNPVSWYNRKEIQELHEYLADDVLLREIDAEEYSDLLARMALNKAHLSIGHHFNKSKTLKRINMMKTTKTKIRNWKWASLLPFVLILLIAFSCNDEAMNDLQKVANESAMAIEIPENIQAELVRLRKENPGAEFEYLETSADNEDELARLKSIDPKTIALVDVNKEENRIGMIVRKNGIMERVQGEVSQDEVFMVVEETATPAGGYETFYKYIAENLKYPEEAKSRGIEGKVYIQMVIGTDGSIEEAVAVKGIGGGCDEEALRVIRNAPAWNPAMQRGKKVKQKIVLPIVFALGGNSEAQNSVGAAKPVNEQMKLDILTEEVSSTGGMVTGKVYDKDGQPLAGVSIVIRGTTKGTVSDRDGSFGIKLDSPDQVLNFSYVGYETVKKSFD